MRPTTMHMCFKVDVIHFTGYGVVAEKPHIGHLPQNFPYTRRKIYALDRKMIGTFLMVSTSSITTQSLGKIVLCEPAVGAKNVVFVFLSHSESSALCIQGVHSLNEHCVTVYGSNLMPFSASFLEGTVFQMHYIVLTFAKLR